MITCATDNHKDVVLSVADIGSEHALGKIVFYPRDVVVHAIDGFVLREIVQIHAVDGLVVRACSHLFDNLLKRAQLHILFRVVLVLPQFVHLNLRSRVGSHLGKKLVPGVRTSRLTLFFLLLLQLLDL